jgi:hypothetical protein
VKPGDVVLVRSVYKGKIRWCFPHRFVDERDGCFLLYLQPGSRGVHMGHGADYLVRWAAGDSAHDHVWHTHHVLWRTRLGERHALGLFWNEDWEFRGWYVNLQAPTERHGNRFDSNDLALDITIEPDGSWDWKDEHEFAQTQELGILDAAGAIELRAEGERVIAAKPWPTGWEEWRPPPEWEPLPLPADWHVV